jgi:hypothetical protein
MKQHYSDQVRDELFAQSAERRAEQFEEGRVKFVLNRCKLLDHKRELLRARARELGQFGRLTFDLFNERFRDFPILLGSHTLGGIKLHQDQRSVLPNWFTNFPKLPFVEAYREFYVARHELANGRPLGVVFPRHGFRQGMIIHNGGLDEYWYRHTMVVYHGGTSKKSYQLFVQAFSPLIDAIYNKGRGWQPGDYPGHGAEAE